MKNRFIKTIFISLLCFILLAGCGVVPTPEITPTPKTTPTPETTPVPTPTPIMTILNKYKAKVGTYPWWIDEVPEEQKIKVAIYCKWELVDFEDREKEIAEAEQKGASEKEILNLYKKYTSIPLSEIMKRYGLEDQIEDVKFFGFTPVVQYVVIDLKIFAKILQDDEVTNVEIAYRESENGDWVYAYQLN